MATYLGYVLAPPKKHLFWFPQNRFLEKAS